MATHSCYPPGRKVWYQRDVPWVDLCSTALVAVVSCLSNGSVIRNFGFLDKRGGDFLTFLSDLAGGADSWVL
ncbi:hypothetical protein AAFF_G00057250 [Aldrovandia affinis]|uniref:Uncharacterized protein n=1 Tax=Aldrovandia affinis TaxID=143900 RepID=A0AAD7WEM6_9TELE|nr:hypothetical protein AAFF_G00057250 [Aldrovandia affinis]